MLFVTELVEREAHHSVDASRLNPKLDKKDSALVAGPWDPASSKRRVPVYGFKRMELDVGTGYEVQRSIFLSTFRVNIFCAGLRESKAVSSGSQPSRCLGIRHKKGSYTYADNFAAIACFGCTPTI